MNEPEFYSVLRRSSGAGGQKFVAVDSGRNSAVFLVRLYPQHPGITANVNIAGQCDLLRKRKDKFDRSACLQASFGQEIQASEAHVSSLALLFEEVIVFRVSHFQRQHHREPACSASLNGLVHRPLPLSIW